MTFILKPGELTLSDLKKLRDENIQVELSQNAHQAILDSKKMVDEIIQTDQTVYGINTGFGALAHTKIPVDQLEILQESLVLSHACGTGELLSDEVVRLILILKINTLAQAYSGVSLEIIQALITLFNKKIYPCIPSQGSVGASGDLAPLAHLAAVLIGEGDARYEGQILSAKEALQQGQLKPLKLAPKEGLALLNGTQVSTALALAALFKIENIFISALIAGSLSLDAARASDAPLDERIHQVRKHEGQIQVAAAMRTLLKGSAIRDSHLACEKVQDPYSLRCQPQVMGACLAHLLFASQTLIQEANAVTDNPLIFTKDRTVLSGGNFHAEPVAFAADMLAIILSEIANLSERRIAILMDPRFTNLPAFLVEEPGINSGFMIAQVTAAALASENKSMAHPASVDSIPTSLDQEDHVSMSTFAAKRLFFIIENATGIVSIELLAACQSIDLLRPLKSSETLERIHDDVRKVVPFYKKDRFFAPDIKAIKSLIQSEQLWALINLDPVLI